MIGRSLSHYRIVEKIGAGGMGEVYRATDTKLNRDVALKVLPEEFARDADRMARFKREAQVLAWLERAVARGYSPAEIRTSIELDNLRNDPKFQALIRPK